MYQNQYKFLLSIVLSWSCTMNVFSYTTPIQDPLNNNPITLQNILTIQPEDMSNIMDSGGLLTITGSGTIHFLQAFFYSDSSCSTLLGAASAIDNVLGMTFTSGQTVGLNASSVYQLANNQGITTGNIACMKVFMNGGNQSPDGVTCQNFTDMSCSGTSCTSSQTKSVSWAASPSTCVTQYSYTTNVTGATVSKCTVNASTGALSSCGSAASGFSGPRSIAINNGYEYIANQNNNTITKCTVSSSDGALSSCASTGSGFTAPQGLALNSSFMYVGQLSLLRQCTVDATNGSLSSCGTAVSGMSDIRGIALNNGYIYLTQAGNNTIQKCTVNSADGTLSSCGSVASGFSGIRAIAINNGYAYITNQTNSTVSQCTINSSDGTLSSCTTTGSGFSGPLGISINNGYAYITNQTNRTVSQCTINSSDGTLSSCATTGSGFASPRYSSIF